MSCLSKFAYKEEPLPAYIEIKSTDRESFRLDRETVNYFGSEVIDDLTLTCCLEDGKQTVIPIIDFDSSILAIVFNWIQTRKTEVRTGFCLFDPTLVCLTVQALRTVMAAANYLQMPELAKATAEMLRAEHGKLVRKCKACKLPLSGGIPIKKSNKGIWR